MRQIAHTRNNGNMTLQKFNQYQKLFNDKAKETYFRIFYVKTFKFDVVYVWTILAENPIDTDELRVVHWIVGNLVKFYIYFLFFLSTFPHLTS